MACIKKTNEKIAAWEANLEMLKNGVFGDLSKECFETLARYWRAQAEADYPYAVENMLYFEQILRERSKK